MEERRRAPRQKSLLRGMAYFGNSPSAVACTIRDISDTGARLKFDQLPYFTETFVLHIPTKSQDHPCKVRWHAGDELGISFEQAVATGSVDDDLVVRVQRLEREIETLKQLLRKVQKTSAGTTEAA